MVQLVLEDLGVEVKTTEGILETAIVHPRQGKETLGLLLQQDTAAINMTERNWTKAVWDPSHSGEMIEFLLEQRGADISILQKTARLAVKVWLENRKMDQLFAAQYHSGKLWMKPKYDLSSERMKAKFETLQLLMRSLVSDCTARQELSQDTIGRHSVGFLLQSLDESSPMGRVDSGLQSIVLRMKEQGFMVSGSPRCAGCDSTSLRVFLEFYRIHGQTPVLDQRTLLDIVTNEDDGKEMCAWLFEKFTIREIPEDLLWEAARSGQIAVLDILLQKARQLPTFAKVHRTAIIKMDRIAQIYNAAKEGEDETVIQLLAEGVSPGTRNLHGHTPLWKAAERGHTRIVEHLLDTGKANRESKDEWGGPSYSGRLH